MADDKDSNFQSDLQKSPEINYFTLGVFIFLTALTWLFIIWLYASYLNYSGKYGKVLSNINYKLKTDISKLNKINTNLVFFKKVNKNQVNVSYILYLLSIHRFGRTYIKYLSVNNGRVRISVFSLENDFARSLNLMNDYTLYLNIYGLQMHTGRFRITSIIEKTTGRNRGITGSLASGRFRYITQ